MSCVLFGLALVSHAWAQPSADQYSTTEPKGGEQQKQKPGPGKEIGSGAGTVGTGIAKGTGALAKGTAQGAGDLVTLHPLRAGASVGKGAATGGKDLTVSAAKGTGKITRGIGRAFKKLI